MLSNLASYIFGANTETVAEGQQIHEVKADKATASSRKANKMKIGKSWVAMSSLP